MTKALIAKAARALLEDPARHTTEAGSIDATGAHVPAAVDAACAWSVFGAVNRIAVLEFNQREHTEPWQNLTRALVARGVTHQTAHADALAALAEVASAVPASGASS